MSRARARARARASMPADWSTPATWWPTAASIGKYLPVPHGASSAVPPGGIKPSTRATHFRCTSQGCLVSAGALVLDIGGQGSSDVTVPYGAGRAKAARVLAALEADGSAQSGAAWTAMPPAPEQRQTAGRGSRPPVPSCLDRGPGGGFTGRRTAVMTWSLLRLARLLLGAGG